MKKCLSPPGLLFHLVLLLGVSQAAQAQAAPAGSRYLHKTWTTEDGLPQSSVTAIAQTRDGYLWLGTFGGLVRFDGVKFTVFDTGNSPGLRSNRVIILFEDRAGALWIGTEHGGLTRYAQGRFMTFTTNDGLPDDWVHGMSDDREGALWVCTPKGIARFNQGRFTTYTVPGLDPGIIARFQEGRDGRFWLPTKKTLFRFENGRLDTFPVPANIPFETVLAFKEARDGSLWVSSDRALYRFHERRFTLLAAYTLNPKLPANLALRFYEDRSGNILMLTPRGVIRTKDERLASLEVVGGLEKIAAGFDLRSVVEDLEGNLWIGGIGLGLHRFRSAQVTAYTAANGLADLSFTPITGAGQGGRDGLWVGGDLGSIFRFQAGAFSRYSHSLPHPSTANLRAVYEDRTGALWAGTYSGLIRFKDGRATRWGSTNSPLTGQPIAAIFEDRAGKLWIGAAREYGEGGLFRFDNESFVVYRTTEGLVFNDVRCIVEDREGALWVGGVGGMSRFKDGRFTNYTTDNGLSHNYVRAIHQTPDGALWIGTYGGGLNRFKDGRFTHITTKDGLFDNVVSRILEDDRGNFWMSCNRGVYRASWKDLSDFADGRAASVNCVVYNASDGMASSETNGGGQPAGWKDTDGKLWFPTQKGVISIDPNRINPTPPLVAIERLLVDAAPQDLYGPISSPPGGNLEIHYTSLSLGAPEKARFKYKLESYDADWIDAGERRVAYYTRIPPGSYRFRVIAANGDGVWNAEGKDLSITVLPPFYRTWWFLTLAVLSGAGAVFAAFNYRVRRLERAQAAQQAFSRKLIESQELERKRIAVGLHDSLGQQLLVIKNWAMIELNAEKENERSREGLNEISNTASQAIEEVRQIIYDLRPYQLDKIGLASTIRFMIEKVAAASQIEFDVAIGEIDGLLSYDSEITLYRIVQECVNNIVKHSQAAKARVRIERDGDAINLTIEDNGRGFAPDEVGAGAVDRGGLGLSGISERVRILGGSHEIHSAPGQGTIVMMRIELKDK